MERETTPHSEEKKRNDLDGRQYEQFGEEFATDILSSQGIDVDPEAIKYFARRKTNYN